ncbi:uncharacterized protein LOC134827593 [Culicoides brevitarsis]|uniref:uncharacterized protein LOC134827593 n=1 Tax=Culicoides brevitarsis TaxID=469753 RepID=UPI00307C62DF
MFLARNIRRVPCRNLCRTLMTEPPKPIQSPVLPLIATTQPLNHQSDWIKVSPTQISFDIGIPATRRKEIFDVPLVPNKIIDNPLSILNEIDEINRRIQEIQLPQITNRGTQGGMEACTKKKNNRPLGIMIIRRKKMKKHKRKKLWKRMRFEWAKRRQRKEFRKEKAFHAELLAQIKDAEKFSAEEYVEQKIQKAIEVPLPRYYRGKRLPADIIRQLIEEDRIKKQKREERLERIAKYRHWKL